MSKHSTASLLARHAPCNWEFADATERAAATYDNAAGDAIAYVEADEGKFARQLDDETIWMLTDYSGPTWVQIGGNGNDTWVTAPAGPSAAGVAGQRAYDSDGFLYVCIATNTWVRYAGSTWTP